MNFVAVGGASPTHGKMDTSINETYTNSEGSHFKWKAQALSVVRTFGADRGVD